MTFYGPAFPNETHYENLYTGRQRFGNRSANMFFVRPARHNAAPRRLKYMHDIKTGYIPYVEDSVYDHRPAQKYVLKKSLEDERVRSNALGLYNSNDVWRQELMDLAQQVKTTLVTTDDNVNEQQIHHQRSVRSPNLHKSHRKRNSNSALSNYGEDDEDHANRRLLHRRVKNQNVRSQTSRPKAFSEKDKIENETIPNEETHDSGIWLIPLLCHILQIDNIDEAQEWLVNANPTEKRLAMELISRTMQDMQNHDNDSGVDLSVVPEPSLSTSNSMNNVYWPYKVWQQKEKQRFSHSRMAKSSSTCGFPLTNTDTYDTCERATSPLRLKTPAKRPSSVADLIAQTDTITSERIVSRPNLDRMNNDGSNAISKRSSSTVVDTMMNDRRSRIGYRVATSMSQTGNSLNARLSPVARGKTPLI